jgi:hypothetical protein
VGADDDGMPEPSLLLAGNRHESGTVRSIATRQDGIVARAQLLAAGAGALLSDGTAAWRWRIIPSSVMQFGGAAAAHGPAGMALHESGRLRAATRQLDERPDDAIADLRDAFARANTLG